METQGKKYYLFSVDLEDVRDMVPNGNQYTAAVVKNTTRYLNWLQKHNAKATFFTVGRTAIANPGLIKEIIAQGHEIACHSHNHHHLTQQSPAEFKADLTENLAALHSCGASNIIGFRAPTFSLTEKSKWAYGGLKELGFQYSTSVLPHSNPLFGWKNFGGEQWVDGIYEIPMNIGGSPLTVPFGGGVYFRALPGFVLKSLFNATAKQGKPVLGYFHPYDVDVEQERFMHPHLNNNPVLNQLMYLNRSKVFNKLDKLMDEGFSIIRYDEYYKLKTQ